MTDIDRMKPFSLEQTWKVLENGCLRIMRKEQITAKDWMDYYNANYEYCSFANSVERPVAKGPQTGGHIMPLYEKLKSFVIADVKKRLERAEKQLSPLELLITYKKEWEDFTSSMSVLHKIFKYINTFWVPQQKNSKNPPVEVYELGVQSWKTELFEVIHERVLSAFLELVKKDRSEEIIDRTLLKTIEESTIAFTSDPADTVKKDYVRFLETPFKDATREYYNIEAIAAVGSNSTAEYMKHVERRLVDERARVASFMFARSLDELDRVCVDVFVKRHALHIRNEFQSLLYDNRADDLRRMYELLDRAGELGTLAKTLEDHIKVTGEKAIEKIATQQQQQQQAAGSNGKNQQVEDAAGEGSSSNGAGGAAGQIDPKLYVQTLLDVHKQYQQLVEHSFAKSKEFVAALDRACRQFVNQNAVGIGPKGSSKSPELLAKYVDMLLKKSSKNLNEAEMDVAQQEVMTLFKYIEEKDVFQMFYSRKLCSRLISGTSASEDGEESMLNKLKLACGFEYTSKLQRMFTDMRVSRDLNDKFKESYPSLDNDLSVFVLTQMSWPLQQSQALFTLPKQLHGSMQIFESFYIRQHSSRKLTWLHQHGKADVKANYLKEAKFFQCSLYQAGVLVLFNNSTTVTLQECTTNTQLEHKTIQSIAQSLVEAKIVSVSDSSLQPSTTMELNLKYSNKKVRIPISTAVKAEQKQESEQTHRNVDEDRKIHIQAAIVRIMKARKVSDFNNLVAETVQQLQSRFQPNINLIRQMIEALIEKEYLERDSNDRNKFRYLA